MAITESILIALFCMAVVFSVLAILWVIVRLFSWIINVIEKRNNNGSATN